MLTTLLPLVAVITGPDRGPNDAGEGRPFLLIADVDPRSRGEPAWFIDEAGRVFHLIQTSGVRGESADGAEPFARLAPDGSLWSRTGLEAWSVVMNDGEVLSTTDRESATHPMRCHIRGCTLACTCAGHDPVARVRFPGRAAWFRVTPMPASPRECRQVLGLMAVVAKELDDHDGDLVVGP
jgi:hypothetical protein